MNRSATKSRHQKSRPYKSGTKRRRSFRCRSKGAAHRTVTGHRRVRVARRQTSATPVRETIRRRGLSGGVGPDDDDDDLSDIVLDPVTDTREEIEQQIREKKLKKEQEEKEETDRQNQEDERHKTAQKAKNVAKRKAEEEAEKEAREVEGYKQRKRAEVTRNLGSCPPKTRQILRPYFDLYKAWGYDVWTGQRHSAYEDATHRPFVDRTGREFTFVPYQVVTDPLMRVLGNIDNYAGINNDRSSLTGRSTDRMADFERNTRATDTYRREILRPYLTPPIQNLLQDLIELGRSHDRPGGNYCVWYAGACADNVWEFYLEHYTRILDNNARIREKFGL